MAKQYRINFVLNSAQALGSAKKLADGLGKIDVAAKLAASTIGKTTRNSAAAFDKLSQSIGRTSGTASAAASGFGRMSAAVANTKTKVSATNNALNQVNTTLGKISKNNANVTSSFNKIGKAASRATRSANQMAGGIGQGAASATAGFLQMGVSLAGAQKGMQALVDLARAYGQAITAAGEKSRELTGKFGDQRDSLAELASIRDQPLNNKFTLDFKKFGRDNMLKDDENVDFQKAFYGSGAQHIGPGKHMTDEQADRFKALSAQFAASTGIDSETMGDLAGNILGSEDYSKHGNQAADKALARLNSTYQILKRGRGSNPVLLRQHVKAAATLMSENRESGAFQTPEQVATGISVMAERSPEQAEVYLRSAIKGLSRFDHDKIGPLLKRAGIQGSDDPNAMFRKFAPVLREESHRRGTNDYVTLKAMGFEEREAGGILAGVHHGIEKGVIADREAYGAQFRDPRKAHAMLDDYRKGEVGRRRYAEGDVELAEAERGAENSKVEILRKQALTNLIKQRRIDTNAANLQNYIKDHASFGALGGGEQELVDKETQRLLNTTAPKGTKQHSFFDEGVLTATGREESLRHQIAEQEAAGGDPMAEVADLLKETNRLLQDQLRQQQESRAGVSGALGAAKDSAGIALGKIAELFDRAVNPGRYQSVPPALPAAPRGGPVRP